MVPNFMTPPAAMRLLAPAKINLHLRVGPRRDDGFHSLLSWMVTVGLFDTLTISPSTQAGLRLSCSDPAVPCDKTNLVCKAATELAQLTGTSADLLTAEVLLEKTIPSGAGLGGGSSDAARSLIGFSRFWGLKVSAEQLASAAARLGSDVPFFLYGSSSVCTGRGEVVRPVAPPSRARWVILVLPGIHMPTPAVYRAFDEMNLGRDEDLVNEPDWAEWSSLGSRELLGRLVNDLEAPAFRISPQLGGMRSEMETALGRTVRMSGSGSSLFSLFDDRGEASSACEKIGARFGVRAECVEVSPATVDG